MSFLERLMYQLRGIACKGARKFVVLDQPEAHYLL
jgi:hypothetical protein